MDSGMPNAEAASLSLPIQSGLSRPALIIKRIEDIVLGGLLLILFTPILICISVAIRQASPGPALFIQERRGRHLRRFWCFKFRTMWCEMTDHEAHEQTRSGDPRVTRFGAFLRHHSLDELPQLINVVLGHMSLCGPRPHALGTKIDGVLLEHINGQYLSRYCVKPGITGWAQVNGWRGILDTPEKLAKRLEYDLYYVQNWSLWLDMRILARTVFCFFDDEQAY